MIGGDRAALNASLDRVRAADAELSARASTMPLPLGDLAPVVTGAVAALGRGDWWVPGLRERAGAVLRDAPIDRIADPQAGARPYRVAPTDTSPALRALVAVGLALSDPSRFVVVHLGIGSAADGAFHEALNLAALTRAHVAFVVAVHPLNGDAPLGPQLAASPANLAAAFGLHTAVVDGSSAAEVHAAVAAARDATGPTLVQADLKPF